MNKRISRLILGFSLLLLLPTTVRAADTLIPVGRIVGLELHNDTVTVAAFDEGSVAQAAGIRIGDRLLSIDGKTVTCVQDVRKALDSSTGSVRIALQRGQDTQTVRVEPAISPEGPKLGIYLRQGTTGIGTVTYYDPDTKTFGALGHGVNSPSGQLLRLVSGNVYSARVTSVRRGRSGDPGQLIGTLTEKESIGMLLRNCAQGVFGKLDVPFRGSAMPVGRSDEVKAGSATILSTVSGTAPQEYSVEIVKIYPASRQNGRNMLIRITDPALLSATGGIVQGMGVSYNRDNTGNPNSLRGFQVTDP